MSVYHIGMTDPIEAQLAREKEATRRVAAAFADKDFMVGVKKAVAGQMNGQKRAPGKTLKRKNAE